MNKFDIVIIAGQSNSEGCGLGEVEKPYVPNSRIMQLDIQKTVEHTPEQLYINFIGEPILSIAEEYDAGNGKLGNLALSFAQKYLESGLLAEDRKLLIVRCGIGGTGFKKGHWGLQGVAYLNMLRMVDYAVNLNKENRLMAFLWHQGEHDAFEKNDPQIFEKQLRDMVNDVRSRYNAPDLPFIAADFVADWKGKNLDDCTPIVAKIQNVVATIDNAKFLPTNGLLSNDQANQNGDDIHFCRKALYELGERYFKVFQEIKNI